MRIGFERFYFVIIGLAVVVLSIVIGRLRKKLFALSVPLGAPGGIPFKPPFSIELLMKLLKAAELIGVFGLFVAAAGPAFISSEQVWLNRGADILFVVDISPSMAGLDMDGQSRFEISKRLVEDFSQARPSDAIGLIALGDDAALLIPPTPDRQVLIDRLDQLQIGELGNGTALGMGLALGAFHIANSQAPRRAVVLITDGENNAGAVNPETAAAMVRDQGASLWLIGVGSFGEIPIDYVDPLTHMRRSGTFNSQYSVASLNAIANSGDGRLLAAPSAEAFVSAFSELNAAEMTIRRSGTINKTESFHISVMLFSAFFILISRIIKRFVLGEYL
ncbi:MAG: VWA domain-containing protein [Treponema sp.]|jgi:Ca-activated chloride channel family protein|nr:VWA domain-containing protein [Treponema sp.]